MMFKKYIWLVFLLTAFLAACSAAAPQPTESGDGQTTEVATPVLQPVDTPEVAAGEEVEEIVPTEAAPPTEVAETGGNEEEPAVGDLPLLPPLPANPSGGGFGGGGGVASLPQAEANDAVGIDRMVIEPFDIFSGTTFVLNTTLPVDPTSAPVWRNPEVYPDLVAAYALAQKLGFPGPLYQDALPVELRDQIESLGEGVYRMPFYAIKGNEWLTITSGSAFYENRGGAQDREAITIPFDQLRPQVEAQIAAWGGLDFEYVIVDDGYNNVTVKRLLNGQPLDFPELYFHFDNEGQLIYASYNVLPALNQLGDYPLISAEAAWEKILGGVMENDVWFSYIYDPTSDAGVPQLLPVEPGDFQFWERKYQAGDTARIYGYPQIFLPVQDDSLPIVQINQYRLNGPAEELRQMVTDRPDQIMIEGIVGADGRSLDLVSWEQLGSDVSPLFLEGVIAREDLGALLQTTDGQTYLLPNLPEDVPNGLEVFVFAWRAMEPADALFPVLDWANIDKRVDFPDPVAVEALPEAPVDDLRIGEPPVITEVVISEVKLGYHYVAQWPSFEEGVEYVPPAYDMPPVLLQPFWMFVGTVDNGQQMAFSVPAVDPAFFQ